MLLLALTIFIYWDMNNDLSNFSYLQNIRIYQVLLQIKQKLPKYKKHHLAYLLSLLPLQLKFLQSTSLPLTLSLQIQPTIIFLVCCNIFQGPGLFPLIFFRIINSHNNNMSQNPTWGQFQCVHPKIASVLKANHMDHPTRIQAEVFSYYAYYHDFLIAAQTGSGKTLAFAAPIISELQYLKENFGLEHFPRKILGLILTPTRELAQQIEKNIILALESLNSQIPVESQLTVSCIIGGISKEKQLRILTQHRPQIIIGTPGRLHELLDQEALQFNYLKYLVIDEADRMIEMGHFRQIDEILERIFMPKKTDYFEKDFQKITKELEENAVKEEFYIKENGRKVKLSLNLNSFPTDQIIELPHNLFTFTGLDEEKPAKGKKEKVKEPKLPKLAKVKELPLTEAELSFLGKLKRRIFFVSATLTREFKGTKYFIKKARTEQEWKEKRGERKERRKTKEKEAMGKGNNKGKNQKQKQEEEKIQEAIPKLKALLSRAQFSEKPKIIDLSSLLFLPQRLVERVCFTQGDIERMTLMVCYLRELPTGSKVIVFSNTIKACKRIQYFIESFGMQVVNLHSHMQQKQRLKKLEKFKSSTLVNILIATDVAARGLDFQITHVVQVGVPVNGDTYVHRAGRTARASRAGEAFILIDKKEANRWVDISDNIAEASPNRKLEKYQPPELVVEETTEKVEKLEWIRRNTEVEDSKKKKQMDMQDANNLGVQIQEEGPRKKYDLDHQEQEQVRQELKKRIAKIKTEHKQQPEQTEFNRWRKNKLVLTSDEIKKYL